MSELHLSHVATKEKNNKYICFIQFFFHEFCFVSSQILSVCQVLYRNKHYDAKLVTSELHLVSFL